MLVFINELTLGRSSARIKKNGGSKSMIFTSRWGSLATAILTLSLLPCRAFAVDKLLIVNGTEITMKAAESEPFVGYILVASDGKIKAVGKGDPPAGTQAETIYDAKGKFFLPGFISP